jgi:uncharacterized repeat protein (TIGR02543 family)
MEVFMNKKNACLWPLLITVIALLALVFLGCPLEPEDDPEGPVVYTINFDVNGGEALESSGKTLTSPPDVTVGLLPVPTHGDGEKIFNGWYTAATGGTVVNSSRLIEDLEWNSGAITLYAQWEDTQQVATYTLTFDANGGTVTPASKQVATPADTIVGDLPVPTHTQAAFAGWYTTAASGGTRITAETAIADAGWSNYALTVYARWTLTINLDVNEGNLLEADSIALSSPLPAAVGSLPAPTRDGEYKWFLGWYTAKTDGVQVTATTTIASLTWTDGAITLYARWSNIEPDITYTLNFNVNGGTGSVESKTVTAKVSAAADTALGEASLPTPNHASLVFAGWYTAASGGTLVNKDTTIGTLTWAANNSITLYARWTEKITTYTINYDVQGGTALEPSSKQVQHPTFLTVGELPAPVKNNSVFMGWYTAVSGGGVRVTSATPLTGLSWTGDAITIYANWKSGSTVTYTINFNAEGGSVSPSSKTVTYPDATTVGDLPTPTKANETFSGWYTAQTGGVKITATTELLDLSGETITLYARWGVPVPGLKLRYDFSGSGTTVSDLAGNNDGTLIGSAALSTHNGIGIMYTGPEEASTQRTGYLDMGTGAGVIFDTNAFSIACYVKFDSDLNYGGNGVLWSFAASADAGQTDPCMLFRARDTQFAISDQGWSGGHEKYVRTGTALEKGRWIHVLYTQDGNTGRIYINGTEASEYTQGPNVDWTISQLGTLTHNYIARPCYGGDATLTKTSFADFMICDIALTADQIALLNIGDMLTVLNQ